MGAKNRSMCSAMNGGLVHKHNACRDMSLGARVWDDHAHNGGIPISLDIQSWKRNHRDCFEL